MCLLKTDLSKNETLDWNTICYFGDFASFGTRCANFQGGSSGGCFKVILSISTVMCALVILVGVVVSQRIADVAGKLVPRKL